MNTVPLFLEPAVFFTLVGLLFLGTAAVVILSGLQDKKMRSAFHDAAERDRLRITELEAIVAAKEEELSKSEKLAASRLKGLEEDAAALKKELALKNQMYDGLKGQYAELEKSYEQSMQNLPQMKPAVKDGQPPMYVIEPEPASMEDRPKSAQPKDLDKLINFIKEE